MVIIVTGAIGIGETGVPIILTLRYRQEKLQARKIQEVLLTYTMPLSPIGISEEKEVGVLSTVQYGGRYWT